jgi:hypothetical protein
MIELITEPTAVEASVAKLLPRHFPTFEPLATLLNTSSSATTTEPLRRLGDLLHEPAGVAG